MTLIYWLQINDTCRPGRRRQAEEFAASLSYREQQTLCQLLRNNSSNAADFIEERGFPRGLTGAFHVAYEQDVTS